MLYMYFSSPSNSCFDYIFFMSKKLRKLLIIWSKNLFFGGVSQRVWQQVALCNFIWGFYWLIFGVYRHFKQYFSYITETSFSDGRSWSTRWEPPTMGKQLVNFITCGCESSAPFFGIYKAGANQHKRRLSSKMSIDMGFKQSSSIRDSFIQY